jgi:hypothetical protein
MEPRIHTVTEGCRGIELTIALGSRAACDASQDKYALANTWDRWAKNPSSFKICEALSGHPFFDKLFSVHENPAIIVQRPKPSIKLPVNIF